MMARSATTSPRLRGEVEAEGFGGLSRGEPVEGAPHPDLLRASFARLGPASGEKEKSLELPHQIRRDLVDAADAEQRQIAIDLVAEQRDGALHAGFAAGDGGIKE